jgi:hypothetical protein
MQRRVAVSKKQRAAKAGASHGSNRISVVRAGHQVGSKLRQRERTAKAHGVSTRKIREVAALAKIDPDIVTRIVNGEVSLKDAKEFLLERGRQAKLKDALKTHVRGEGIHTGHMNRLFRILDDDSVDLFITDPPYEKKALTLYTELGKLAQQKLKPGGFCLVECGQLYLDDVIVRLAESLDWYWLCGVKLSHGHTRIWHRRISNTYKPFLMFAKRPAPTQSKHLWLTDLVHSTHADKSHHKHGQGVSEFQYYIERLTLPGDLVVDPFVGGGTVPEICAITKRNFIGAELNPGTAAAARARVVAAKVKKG